ncbi:MAG: hypothetical protein IAI48_04880, partial [Candidatus Eremiobacteraeota bacterium]|nr:hypothetical protein [Candidatus Eremiobacteraeota bacterium]
MTRRIDISSDREIAALRSIRSVLSHAPAPARFFRIRSKARRRVRVEATPYDNGRAAIAHDASPTATATKALGYAYLAALERRYGAVAPVMPDAALDLDAVVFDRSAFLALARGNASVRRSFERALAANVRMVAPATALLDARAFDVARELAAIVEIVAIDADTAMAAARLVADARLDLPLDALTVACVPPP